MGYFGVPIRNGVPIGLGSIVGFGVQQFSPADLFTAGEQGVWYDPSDLTTLFQESTGVTPVTAIEQPVGLMLDKSKGLVLGPELITPEANRDFSSDTGYWSKSGSTISGGVASGPQYSAISRNFLLTVGVLYEVQWTVVAGGIKLALGTNTTAILGPGTYTTRIVANGVQLTFYFDGATGGTLDNVSVKSLPGNHAIAANNSTKRPYLSARVNLLTKTEAFDDAAVWTKANVTSASPVVTANQGIAPDGTNTADKVEFGAITGASDYSRLFQSFTSVATTYAGSVYLKAFGPGDVGKKIFVWIFDTAGRDTQTVILTDSWQRVNSTSALVAGTSYITLQTAGSSVVAGGGAQAVTTALVWGADLRATNQGVNLPVYQAVNTSTDYSTAGFPLYLRFDGVDDAMASNSIDFTATDKMTVWAGVRKLSDALAATLCELSASPSTNNGMFALSPGDYINGTGPYYFHGARGTAALAANQYAVTPANFASPITNVLTGQSDIAASTSSINVNTVLQATATGSKGTGNFGNYPLYVGARNQTSQYFNGQLFGLIVRGAASTSPQISATETYMNQKTRAY